MIAINSTETVETSAAPTAASQAMALRTVLLVSLCSFSALAVLQTLAEYGDRGLSVGAFFSLLLSIAMFYPPWIVFSVVLFSFLDRRSDQPAKPLAVTAMFAACTLFFFLPYMVFEVTVIVLREGGSLLSVPERMIHWPGFGYFVDYVLFSGCFSLIYGLALGRGQIERDRRNQRLQARMLSMQLQLEHQRLAAIQAQLEPHFLFNALSAISALVRTEDKRNALSAITRLSELLRYTLTASRRDWVSLAEELNFIRDYLSLQALRHGERLQLHIEAELDGLGDFACPPLLLQPLVENALRHDLETHEHASDIRLQIRAQGDGVQIQLSNPISNQAVPNPGLGLGLSNTRDRLALRYGDTATMRAGVVGQRYQVELYLPEAERV